MKHKYNFDILRVVFYSRKWLEAICEFSIFLDLSWSYYGVILLVHVDYLNKLHQKSYICCCVDHIDTGNGYF